MKCPACGAQLGATDPTCTYCGKVTAYGAHLDQQRQHHEAHLEAVRTHHERAEQHQRQAEARASLARTSRHALIWSLAGLVLCCAFVPSAVAVVLGFRARKMAHKYSLVLPVHATAGLALGVVGVLAGAAVITVGIVTNAQREERLEAITVELGNRAAATQLEQPVACLLAERRLLQGGYQNDKIVDDFECDGKLEQSGDRATLHDVRFVRSGSPIVLEACLVRGARWTTRDFRTTGSCDAPEDGSNATTTATSPGAVAPSAPGDGPGAPTNSP